MKTEKIILEIRASEGGNDSKMLVEDLRDIYLKSANLNNFECGIQDSRSGFCSI